MTNYLSRYQALNLSQRAKFRERLFYYFQWSDQTIYNKLNEMNLNRIERQIISGLLDYIEQQDTQLSLDFVFDIAEGVVHAA